MKIKYPLEDVYTLSVDETISSFQTNIEKGLSQSEADNRIKEFGSNIYKATGGTN